MSNPSFIELTCDQVRQYKDQWIKDVKAPVSKDHIDWRWSAEARLCKEIDEFLSKCKCKEAWLEKENLDKWLEQCDKCTPEEHEGWACRCEERNMVVAQERRRLGKGEWKELDDRHKR